MKKSNNILKTELLCGCKCILLLNLEVSFKFCKWHNTDRMQKTIRRMLLDRMCELQVHEHIVFGLAKIAEETYG